MTSAERKKVLLLVDDTPEALRMIDFLLRGAYVTRLATSGAMALEMAKSQPTPDLILLDIVMPGIDGFEVCSRLKEDPETRDTPVIFLTGQSELVDEQRGFAVGGVDYIQKPFHDAIMKARIHTHLMLSGAREQLLRQLRSLMNELETARRVQLSILPHQAPRIEGLDIASRYLPMAALAGDFYDFLVLDSRRVGVLVADVSGHGMPAALVGAMLKILLADQLPHASQPAQVLAGLNQSLLGKFADHYVTASYAFVDTEAKIIRYAAAGHPPCLLCDSRNGGMREVMENGLYLGSFPDATYTQVELPFSPGEWLVLYTDGLTEAGNRLGEEFGIRRVKESLCKNCASSADAQADALLAEVWHWIARQAGEELEDDVTFVLLRASGPAPPCASRTPAT